MYHHSGLVGDVLDAFSFGLLLLSGALNSTTGFKVSYLPGIVFSSKYRLVFQVLSFLRSTVLSSNLSHGEQARAGEITNMTGIAADAPYEAPESPEIELKAEGCTAELCADKLSTYLREKGYLGVNP